MQMIVSVVVVFFSSLSEQGLSEIILCPLQHEERHVRPRVRPEERAHVLGARRVPLQSTRAQRHHAAAGGAVHDQVRECLYSL